MNLLWEQKEFPLLSNIEVHEILCARQSVFVVEQQLICEDADEFDLTCIHIIGREKSSNIIAAYARIHPPGSKQADASFGRVLVCLPHRKTGLGSQLVELCIQACQSRYRDSRIRISAQTDSTGFYEKLGFSFEGNSYLDAGIAHIDMVYLP